MYVSSQLAHSTGIKSADINFSKPSNFKPTAPQIPHAKPQDGGFSAFVKLREEKRNSNDCR